MTIQEYRKLKEGDKIVHHMYPNTVCVIEGKETKHGFFHRPEGSRGGWNTINERTCKYYERSKVCG